ncbi:MAG: ATP synthase F1 subunit gamma [Chloroflexi bacterium]|nr:ATP synthase F1 subunit gamma [Chloroflexota bacterium]
MPSLQDIRRRIRGVRNTAQITKAMELVAASRMRRAQLRVTAARPYAETMRTFISELAAVAAGSQSDELHPLLEQREVDTVGIIVITADRGLCGALNANVIRRASELILAQTHPVELMTIGRKGQDFMARRGYKIFASITGIGDRPTYEQIIPIARNVMESFMERRMDECYLVYPEYISTLTQRPRVQKILPIVSGGDEPARPVDYIFEPDPKSILNELLPRYVEVLIYEAILEAQASEQSARMVAMRNANQNAQDLIKDLTLVYNKTRQAAITREVIEIASAAEFMAAQSR